MYTGIHTYIHVLMRTCPYIHQGCAFIAYKELPRPTHRAARVKAILTAFKILCPDDFSRFLLFSDDGFNQ